jgi:hypothetical protein
MGAASRIPQLDTLQRIASALGRQLKLVFVMPTEKATMVEVETPGRRTRKKSIEAQAAVE